MFNSVETASWDAMKYTLKTPNIVGETIPLYTVAEAMAKRRALAGDKGFDKPGFDTALAEFIKVLIHDAKDGRLKVCNQFGMSGTPAEISAAAHGTGMVVKGADENVTMALHVWAHLHSINIWANDRGDIFHIDSQVVDYVDERGVVKPSSSYVAKEDAKPISKNVPDLTKNDDHGGVKTPTAQDAVVLTRPSTVVTSWLTTKQISDAFSGLNDWRPDRWPKNLSQSKWLHAARESPGLAGGPSALWNPLTLAQLLHAKKGVQRNKTMLVQSLRSRFRNIPALQPWKDALNDYCDTYDVED